MKARLALYVLLALAAVQVARVTLFMFDNDRAGDVAVPQHWWRFYTSHSCYAPYIVAGAMSRAHAPHIYDLSALDRPDVHCIPTEMVGSAFARSLDCHDDTLGGLGFEPYEYPPPFLLLPRAGLAVSDDFFTLRTAWYLIELLTFGLALWLLARFVGGRERRTVLLLTPAILISLPVLLTLQIGNFQLPAFAWSMLAMLAFETGNDAAGGFVLAFVTLSKIYPGALVVLLLARGKWRSVAWTAGAGVALLALSLAVLGWAPFDEFLHFQLPRLQSGEAFPWVEHHASVDSAIRYAGVNFSPYGLIKKVEVLGVPGMGRTTANALLWVYGLAALALAWLVGRWQRSSADTSEKRLVRVAAWLAVLTLASLRSPFAPNVYVQIGPLWLLALGLAGRRWIALRAALFCVLWIVISEGKGNFPNSWLGFAIECVQHAAVMVACVLALREQRQDWLDR